MIDDELLYRLLSQDMLRAQEQGLPRNRALYEAMRNAIRQQQIPAHAKLPSSRFLARHLGLGRNTVLTALDQLLAEGYVHSEPARGLFAAAAPVQRAGGAGVLRQHETGAATHAPQLSRRGQSLSRCGSMQPFRGAFAPGIPDLSSFPYAKWQHYCTRMGRNPKLDWLGYAYQGGLPDLRSAIAAHVRIARFVQCAPEQVLVTSGTQQSLMLLAQLLADHGDLAWIEDPGYPGAQCAFSAAGLKIRGIRVDGDGIVLPSRATAQPKLIYVSPSHQYPTGVCMSLARREALIRYAQTHRCWIVEDDYDSEFHHGNAPLAALAALTELDSSVYLGTFSKTMFPALRMAYIILPRQLIEPATHMLTRYYREPPYIQQAALAAFIADGHLARHIRSMRKIYRQRRDILAHIWQQTFADALPLAGLDAGMHVSVRLPEALSDLELEENVAAAGVRVRALSRYAIDHACNGLLLGFGDADERKLVAASKTLVKIVACNFARIGKDHSTIIG